MNEKERDTLRDLLRRVEEARGLGSTGEPAAAGEPGAATVAAALDELVQELERSQRRLIETNVQLVSLREVASHLLGHHDGDDPTRTVTRYLCRAFDYEFGLLLLVNREAGTLEGTWTRTRDGRERCHAVTVPLLGDHGALARATWLNRTVLHHAPPRHVAAALPEGHPLQDSLEDIGSLACVPLQRSQHVLPGGETHELCGARCIVGDVGLLVPPPGQEASRWAADREERQRHCLGCEMLPSLGVIGFARGPQGRPLDGGDVTLLESIALSIAPVVENARLTQELRRSERFRNHVLDSMASALIAVNMSGEILTFNRAAEALLGHREADVLGQPFGARFGTDGEELIRDTLEHGRETRAEIVLRAHDGTPVPVRLTTSLLRDERRAIYGAIATFVDLTPLRRAEEHARRLDRLAALGRFTSSVAHEIRNPLTGIGAGIQYLARALGGEEEHRENLEFILREIRRLDRIVQDLFEVTHPRGLQVRTSPVEETVRRAVQCLDALMRERGIRLALDAVPRTPAVPHDEDQLQQVLINLIKNAIEASRDGATLHIEVAPAAVSGGGSGPHDAVPGVAVRVRDEGHGIGADQLKTIFEPFFTTKPGGSGLGLYISHDIVKRHGGSLTVSSEPGRGTTFTVELPLDNHGGPQ
jgi:PAS domain S-box-containing protein